MRCCPEDFFEGSGVLLHFAFFASFEFVIFEVHCIIFLLFCMILAFFFVSFSFE